MEGFSLGDYGAQLDTDIDGWRWIKIGDFIYLSRFWNTLDITLLSWTLRYRNSTMALLVILYTQ